MIRLYNTLSSQVEDFKPLREGEVGMYHCGPTVYNYAHIGNLRSYVFADILRRFFEYEKYNVKQVMNITDVGHLVSDSDEGEDKMLIGAKREGKSAKEIAEFYTKAFFKDLALLNIETTDTIFPKATEHITEQIALIQKLEEKGYAYTISDGVYFYTSKFPDYGKLGHINLKGLEEGARIGINIEKKNLTDFALWKFNTTGEKREQEWPSPWGVGFPGWHIECSAMSMKYLGETFDIHTGGIDHIPVHHQNEIAQSESATGKPFVDYWMHNEHLHVNNERIAKSLGNQILLDDIIKKGFSPLAYRYFLLLSHYRTQTNFSWEALEASQNAYRKLKEYFASLSRPLPNPSPKLGEGQGGGVMYKKEFLSAIENDLNTPEALAVVWKLIKDDSISPADKHTILLDFDKVLGLDLENNEYEIKDIPAEVQSLIDERQTARDNKNFAKSDELREQIKALGFEVKDTENGQQISRISLLDK